GRRPRGARRHRPAPAGRARSPGAGRRARLEARPGDPGEAPHRVPRSHRQARAARGGAPGGRRADRGSQGRGPGAKNRAGAAGAEGKEERGAAVTGPEKGKGKGTGKPSARDVWEGIDDESFKAEVERVIGMSDAEVEAELIRDGFDPAKLGAGAQQPA